MISDMEFARELAPEVATHYRISKAWATKVPETALLRLRAMCETCCELLELRYAIPRLDRSTPDLVRRIDRLANGSVIAPGLRQLFNSLRDKGNLAAHPGNNPDYESRLPGYVKLAMNQALGVLEWMWPLLHPTREILMYSVQSVDDGDVAHTCERAVVEGHPESQFILGKMMTRKCADLYLVAKQIAVQNDGGTLGSPEVGKVWEQALFWYKQSADGGYLPALTEYGINLISKRYREEDVQQGQRLLQQAGDRGDPAAHAFIGYCLLYGCNGYELDLELARSHLERAVVAEHPVALAELGRMYWLGLGGSKDAEQGAAMTLKAAELGNVEGQFNAYILLHNGLGRAVDRVRAREWLEKAVQQDHDQAAIQLSRILREEPGGTNFEAVERLLKTAMVNSTLAHYELAKLYLEAGSTVVHTVNAAHLIAYCYRSALQSEDAELKAKCAHAGPIAFERLELALPYVPQPYLKAAMQVQAEYHPTGRPCETEREMVVRHEVLMRNYERMTAFLQHAQQHLVVAVGPGPVNLKRLQI